MKRWMALVAVIVLSGCGEHGARRVQGYVEGEFVHVASPIAGQLKELDVQRGAQVKAGDPLFTLEAGAETAARDEAARRLAQAEANLADARLGQRPSEIESIEAQLEQAAAALVLSETEFDRQEKLVRTGASATQELDRARSARDQDRKRKSKLEADLATARLGAREDQIAAAAANVEAQRAALAKAQWSLDQKRQAAPKAGLVFDTLYREGEWVSAGMPVVSLLPLENVSVRAFVPEPWIGTVKPGDVARVFVDGVRDPLAGRVSYVAPRAEFTPPVIYSNEAREKLVFLVRVEFDPATAARLNPGQPVDVDFGP